MGRVGLLLLVAAALVMGCGDNTVTVTEEAPAPAAPQGAQREAEPDRAPARAEEPAVSDSVAGSSVTVPDVVGEDHQLAQDTLQAAGLYLLDEQDCTGQDRALLWDRNWVVVRQSPVAGSNVSADTTITLCSKKDGE
jgi:hypothetical protein